MRIILFTGKGGTGKTTCAAATAYQAAQEGKKTLIISTDPAHSLSDALDIKLGAEPTKIAPNLYAQELDVYYSMRKYWGNIRNLMLQVFKWQGVDSILAEELSAIPGMEEGSAFLWIEKYYTEKAYDVIIIDSAPTGETLTFLSLPQVTKWWTTKAFPFQKTALKFVGGAVNLTTGIPLDKGFDELENLFDKLERVQKIFSKPDICSIRIICNPEKMVIQEAKRAYTYLQLYGYNIDAVIVNRLLPQEEQGSFFAHYLKSQKAYLEEIEDIFAPLPILKVPHLGEEVFGQKLLAKISQAIYKDRNATDVFYRESPFEIEQITGGYRVRLRLPFLEKDQIKITQFGDELVIDIQNKRRNLFLPKFFSFYQIKNYEYSEPWLRVNFVKKAV
ncbi:ArsA family ATPase [Hugenholtzia roseola]|uniref:ArsA family ATPase n=1 Tax=Hugenholtzia roseola TaxID=1002 RepID=UPI00040D6947|nr:ArsA family ATPase [Hugenholtzia roseola]